MTLLPVPEPLTPEACGPLRRVHRHADSEECFAPLHGRPCIAVAEPPRPWATASNDADTGLPGRGP